MLPYYSKCPLSTGKQQRLGDDVADVVKIGYTLYSLAQTYNLAINEIDVVGLGVFGQARHTKDVASDGNNHLSTGIEHNVLDEDVEARNGSILLGIGRERELCLRDAHGEMSHAMLLRQLDALEGCLAKADAGCAVDGLCHLFNFRLDGVVVAIGEVERLRRGMLLDGIYHELSHLFSALAAFGVSIVDDERNAEFLLAMLAEEGHLTFGVGDETVEHYYYALAKTLEVFHVAIEVGQTATKSLFVGFLNFVELHATMHLQALSRCHNDGEVGLKTALAAKDVIELLCAEVGTEASLRDGIVGVAKRHAGGHKRVATMSNVGKWAAMNDCGSILCGLHEVGLNGIFQKHHDGTSHTKILHRERSALIGVAQKYVLDAATEVGLILGQAEDGHEFGSRCDVEASLLRDAVGCRTKARYNAAKRTVVDIEHTTPKDFAKTKALLLVLVKIVVEKSRNHVVGRGDGVEVAREMEVDALHGEHLSIATTSSTALHAEARTERGFAQCNAGLLADGIETKSQTDAHRCLANARTSGRDSRDEDELTLTLFVDEREGKLGDVLAVVLNVFGVDAQLLCHLVDALKSGAVCNFDVCFHCF